jgi:hypothetical protein
MVLKEAIGIFAVAAVGGPTRRLYIGDSIRIRPQDTEESLRVHGAGTNLNVIWLLEDAASIAPVLL